MSLRDIVEYFSMSQPQQGAAPSSPMPQQMPSQAHQNLPQGDPIQKGSVDAMEAVRQSLGARKHNPWMRLGAETLADLSKMTFAKSPTAFGQRMAAENFNPYEAQDQKAAENMKIMEFLQRAEQTRQLQEERHSSHQETARHHQAMEGLYQQKNGQQVAGNSIVDIDGNSVDVSAYSPIEGKSELTRLQKSKSMLGNTLNAIDSSLKHLDELDGITEGDKIKPTDPYMGNISQGYTNIKASLGNERAIKERNTTKLLNDSLTKVRILIESATKGGLPGEQMMKRFEEKGILPHINDSSSTIREKLNAIKGEISNMREAADLSIKTKRNIDVHDLENIKGTEEPKTANQNRVDPMQMTSEQRQALIRAKTKQ